MKTIAIIAALALTGCTKPEVRTLLIDPTTGCQYVMTQYGGEVVGGSYIKPLTNKQGKPLCAQMI